MNDKKGRKNPQGTSNQRVEVKPQGDGVRARGIGLKVGHFAEF